MLGFLHHKSSGESAGDDGASGTGGDKHHLMIWLTVGVLIIGFLTYKRMSAQSSATPTIGAAGNSSTGSTGAGDGVGGQVGYFNQALAGLQSQLTADESQNASDLASLDASNQAAQSAWDARLSGLTDSWAKISDTVANIGSQTQANTTVTTGLSQSDTQGAGGLTSALQDQLSRNAERVTDEIKSTTGGMLYLTDKGGVYTSDGANYFGSYLGYANKTSNPGAEIQGHGDFSQGHIQALAGGNYEIFNNKGEGYTFNQETKAKGY